MGPPAARVQPVAARGGALRGRRGLLGAAGAPGAAAARAGARARARLAAALHRHPALRSAERMYFCSHFCI